MSDRVLHWSARARHDLRNIQAYIGQDNPVAAAQTVLKIAHQTEAIQAYPLSFEAIHPDRPEFRSMVIKPYAVLYRVTAEEVLIIRVIHTPMKWK